MCQCRGRQSLTVTFEMGPSGALPLSEENLKKVTSIGYNSKLDALALLVERVPGEPGPDSYEVILLPHEGVGDFPNVGEGGLKLVQMLLETITGQPFEKITEPDSETMHVFRRKDFSERIRAYESTHNE